MTVPANTNAEDVDLPEVQVEIPPARPSRAHLRRPAPPAPPPPLPSAPADDAGDEIFDEISSW